MGDEIINTSIAANWPQLFEGNYILRMPTHTPLFYTWQNWYSGKNSTYSSVDYKIICGTNLLYTDMLRPKPSWNIYLWNTSIVKGAVLLGVGRGKNSEKVSWYTRRLYSKVLNKDLVHSVRDAKTAEILDDLGLKVANTGCPTLWGLTGDHCKGIPSTKANRAVFTLTCYHPDVERDRSMIDAIRKNYSDAYFWPQTLKDLEYLEELVSLDGINLVPPNLSAFDRLLLEGDIDYIGNRLHGGIYALQHRCRAVIIGIDYRASGMNESFSIPFLPREQISELPEMIKRVLGDNDNGSGFRLDREVEIPVPLLRGLLCSVVVIGAA